MQLISWDSAQCQGVHFPRTKMYSELISEYRTTVLKILAFTNVTLCWLILHIYQCIEEVVPLPTLT